LSNTLTTFQINQVNSLLINRKCSKS